MKTANKNQVFEQSTSSIMVPIAATPNRQRYAPIGRSTRQRGCRSEGQLGNEAEAHNAR
jgi:hypothetical protein